FQHANNILERIASDEIFAKNVRDLTIRGYSQRADHEGIRSSATDERMRSYLVVHLGLLLQALKNLTSLKSLRISRSDLDRSVAQGILEYHPHLQTLSFGKSGVIPPDLAAISSLQSLSLWSVANSIQNQETTSSILQNCGDTLRDLELGAIEGAAAWLEQ
ncbi:hypothetical protein FRC01_012498, partial [Tulasnella sp. 417]